MIQIQGKVLSAQLLPEKERPTILKCLEYLPKHFDFSRWWVVEYVLLALVCLPQTHVAKHKENLELVCWVFVCKISA